MRQQPHYPASQLRRQLPFPKQVREVRGVFVRVDAAAVHEI